jgi:ribosomal protein S18 acetylase RimI-like enzyme
MKIEIRKFSMSEYKEVTTFWASIPEVGLDDADSISSMELFLKRNKGLSFVSRHDGKVIGAVLCGHDGRRGYLHHLAVHPNYRGMGVGKRLVDKCLSILSKRGISRCNIFIYSDNEMGKKFWKKTGWRTYDGLEIMYKNVEHLCSAEQKTVR